MQRFQNDPQAIFTSSVLQEHGLCLPPRYILRQTSYPLFPILNIFHKTISRHSEMLTETLTFVQSAIRAAIRAMNYLYRLLPL